MLPGSWMGPTPSKTADTPEPVTSQKRSALNTEYKLKFRPFSDYAYVDGHFTGAAAADVPDGEPAERRATTASATAPVTPWYEEVVELRKKASSYKVRGWGKEMAQPHLAHLYDREQDRGGALAAERKIISALYLETLKPGFVREERGRSPVTTGGAAVRQQSHPPPSSRKSPAAAKMALKLHAAEGGKRPHSAQPSTDRHAGDTVDRPKGRSPATPRAPSARTTTDSARTTDSAPAPTRPRTKRPTDKPPSVDKPSVAESKTAARHTAADKSHRPPAAERAEKTRPSTAKSDGPSRPAQAAAAGTGAADSGTPRASGGKGIRGGTPRSRSAHRLADKSAKESERVPPAADPMTVSAPAASAPSTKTVKKPAKEAAPEQKTPEPQQAPDATQQTTAPPPADDQPQSQQQETEQPSTMDGPATEPARGPEEVVRSVPEPTRVKSPEGMAPIKSPEPVNWTVPLDTGKTFTVTQNVMAGGHGSPMSSRADSLRSPTEDAVRSPLARGVTDVSHLRNGETAPPPPVESPITDGLPPPATNGRDDGPHYQTGGADDDEPSYPTGAGAGRQDDMMQGSFHADVGFGGGDVGFGGGVRKALQDPMSASMTGDDLRRSLMTEDPMTASMTGDDLERSLHGKDMERSLHDPMAMSMTGEDLGEELQRPSMDPMTASMTGDDLRRSLHDPLASSLTGDEMQRSFHSEKPDVPLPASVPVPMTAQRVLDDPLMATATFSRPAEPPSFSQQRPPASALFSSGSAGPPAASALFSSGSAGPPRFSHELFGSSGKPAEQKPEAAEKPLYRVI